MNSPIIAALSCALLLATFSSPGRADLVWSEKEISLHPALEDATAIAHYRFRNSGDQPVTISQVTTSCPCTTAQADKSIYLPGEKGEITATFNVPVVTGLEKKQIYVTTSETKGKTTLDLKIYIPEIMKLTPPRLSWQQNEPLTPKTLSVEMIAPQEINVFHLLLGPRVTHFSAQLQTVEPHKKYLVTVTPLATDAPVLEQIGLLTDYPAYQPKCIWVPLAVSAAPR